MPIEIIADDQDFTHERLREGQVLGCVTTLKAPLRGCSVTPLGFMKYVAVATPEVKQEKLSGNTLGKHNFRAVPFIAFNRKDDMAGEFVTKAFAGGVAATSGAGRHGRRHTGQCVPRPCATDWSLLALLELTVGRAGLAVKRADDSGAA